MTNKEIIDELVNKGCKVIRNIKVKNVTPTEMQDYTRLSLTCDKEVPAYVPKPDKTIELGTSNIIYASTFSIGSLLKEDDNAAFAANHLIKNPDGFQVALSRAIIDVIQEEVAAGEEYRNPFAKEDKRTVFDHDVIINHVIKIQLSDFGIRKLDGLADRMMGL